jgi:aspartyl-tRNA(Asn)/glutamyl-tRNA(Gln) amidotransferase subunit B
MGGNARVIDLKSGKVIAHAEKIDLEIFSRSQVRKTVFSILSSLNEIQRQIDLVERGEKIIQETRLYDTDKNRTFSMRSKEEAHDYRYFPNPDLLNLQAPASLVEKIQKELPELPLARAERFKSDFGLPEYDANILTGSRSMAEYFENTTKVSGNAKAASNWIMTEVLREMNDKKLEIEQFPIKPEALGKMIALIDKGTISSKIAKTVFSEMLLSNKDPEVIVKEKGLVQITDSSAIDKWVDEVIAAKPKRQVLIVSSVAPREWR